MTKSFYACTATLTALILADAAFATMSSSARIETAAFAVLFATASFFVGRQLNSQPDQK